MMKTVKYSRLLVCLLAMGFSSAQAQFEVATHHKATEHQLYEKEQLSAENTRIAESGHGPYRYQFATKRKGTGHNLFVFSAAINRYAAYDAAGNLVRTGDASGGKESYHTPAGTYSVYRKGDASCRSKKYDADTPHCMFFHGGYAIHGSADVPDANASHGCIRVHPEDAAWLHRNFIKHGTTVKVLSYKL